MNVETQDYAVGRRVLYHHRKITFQLFKRSYTRPDGIAKPAVNFAYNYSHILVRTLRTDPRQSRCRMVIKHKYKDLKSDIICDSEPYIQDGHKQIFLTMCRKGDKKSSSNVSYGL